MADQSDETTPKTDEKDHLVHPDGMNPHSAPEEESAEEETTDDDA